MPKVSDAYTNARRDEIVKTAARLFGVNGFRATQMRDVAEGAGLSTGAVYRYFPSKDELVRAVISSLKEGEDSLRERILGEGSAIERLERLPAEFIRFSESDVQNRRNFRDYGEAATMPLLEEGLREVVVRGTRSFEALVREAQEAGDIKPELDPTMTALAISTLIVSVRFGRLFGGPFDGPALAKTLDVMIAGLRAS